MKRLLLMVTLLAMFVTACDTSSSKDAVISEPVEIVEVTEVEEVLVEEASTEEEVLEEVKKKVVEMPQLPDIDFEGMTFKEDGYEIVEFKSLADGDTANFVVGGMTMACRFLAIDTPETSGSSGLQPWALAAKAYTQNALENAEVIIIEKDLESDIVDNYGRLLGWIWVDGHLLNYQLVEEGLAYVKYLYGDYKYNPTMISLESSVQKTKIKIWGEDDPDYNYDATAQVVTIKEAKTLDPGSLVTIKGVVTASIGQNAFISDGTAGVYIYANKYNYGALGQVGTEIELTGKVIDYNGLTEISSIVDNKITTISEGNEVMPIDLEVTAIAEAYEGSFVRLTDLTIVRVDISDGGGYDIVVSSDGVYTSIRIDKYLEDYPDPDQLVIGSVIDVVGGVGQYLDNYQIMISKSGDISYH